MNDLICPYCKNKSSYEYPECPAGDGESATPKCHSCHQEFYVTCHETYDWSYEVMCNEDKHIFEKVDDCDLVECKNCKTLR